MRYANVVLVLICAVPTLAAQAVHPAEASAPEVLSFEQLNTLSKTAKPEGALGERLNKILTTPVIQNIADTASTQPHRPVVKGLGPSLRVGFWNIERGLNFNLIHSALAEDAEFRASALTASSNRASAIRDELRNLRDADILALNEVDLGMKRTEYRDVARDLAGKLRMNYAYGVEFVEVDPLFDLDTERISLPDRALQQRLEEDLRVDTDRYHGLHGNAVLSRYPILHARIIRLPVCYDWYGSEVRAISQLERGKRWSARKLFRERIEREVRHGGRMALVVDVAMPDLPTGELTVVSAHLENRCPPACRQKQVAALLAAIQTVRNPVVLAGDLNSSGRDTAPTSVRNEIMKRVTDYRFWVTRAVFWYSPVPQYVLFPIRYFHSYLDPTAWHFPFLWENRERGLFKRIERFRFDDGYAFDFRGKRKRTLNGRQRTLADSNQRGSKGFIPTYTFERDFGGWTGRFKLDWFFVKPFIRDPRRNGQSYKLAPHFPITMRDLNESVEERISDHPPMTVDLPFAEPQAFDR